MSQFSPTFFVSSNDPASPDVVDLGAGAGTAYEVANCGKYPVYVAVVSAGGATSPVTILPRSEGTVTADSNAVMTGLEFHIPSARVRYAALSPGASPPHKAVCKIEITKHS